MPRYKFDDFVINANDLVSGKRGHKVLDQHGYSLIDWIDYGIIGFDELSNTFFIQLDMNEDEPEFWISNIESVTILCVVIDKIFSVKKRLFTKSIFKYNKKLFKYRFEF
ncbi:hypothetical protein KX00_2119 [Francisella sp. TX07-6608]|nr:hypothetical protein KX00_2101 [Francisella sp. TX07-6608]OIN85054.1 hypothetical protein KX00_2119 [Francisella sp. TX07-6608]